MARRVGEDDDSVVAAHRLAIQEGPIMQVDALSNDDLQTGKTMKRPCPGRTGTQPRGIDSVATAPPSGWLASRADPPCSWATSRTNASPNPVPLRPPGRAVE